MTNNLISDLKALHQAITKNYHTEQELFNEYLAIGCRIFEMETGIVSSIKGDIYTILAYSSPLEGLSIGLEFALEDTYCREVIAEEKTIAIAAVGQDIKLCEHPVYKNMKLEAYISAPIYVNGNIFGTINFTDRTIKDGGFNRNQLEVLEIMAKATGRFIEAKIYKDNLQSANDKINQLVGTVAHDLKNPLGTISSIVEVIEEEIEDLKLREFLDLIKITSNNSLEMVQSILDMSAIESGKIKIKRSETKLKEVVSLAWNNVKHLATKKDIDLVQDIADIKMNIDQQRIAQSLANLFSNAIKFSPRGSKIKINAKETTDSTIVSITDNGIGMSEKQMASIFDPTKTTSTPGTEGEIGTGYGLPLVAQIIEFHNGKINVTSSPNEGTTFTISFPKS